MLTLATTALESLEELYKAIKQMSEQEAMCYYEKDRKQIDALSRKASELYYLLRRPRDLLWAKYLEEIRQSVQQMIKSNRDNAVYRDDGST